MPTFAELDRRDIDAYVATGRLKHHQAPPPAPRGRIPPNATRTERMARKLRLTGVTSGVIQLRLFREHGVSTDTFIPVQSSLPRRPQPAAQSELCRDPRAVPESQFRVR
jgi:hypothetical protein